MIYRSMVILCLNFTHESLLLLLTLRFHNIRFILGSIRTSRQLSGTLIHIIVCFLLSLSWHFRVSRLISENKRLLTLTFLVGICLFCVHQDFIDLCFLNEVHLDILALHWLSIRVGYLAWNMILTFCCHFSRGKLRLEFVLSFLSFFDSHDCRFCSG